MIPKIAPLTIIGADRDSVFIGPVTLTPSVSGYPTGVIVQDGVNIGSISVSSVTLENTAILAWYISRTHLLIVTLEPPKMSRLHWTMVSRCDPELRFRRHGPQWLDGRDHEFCRWPQSAGYAVELCFSRSGQATLLTGSDGFEYSNLQFEGVGVALGFEYGSTGTVTNCQIGESSLQTWRIVADSGSKVTMAHVNVAPSPGAISLDDANTSLTGTHLHLGGGSYATVYVATGASITLRDCDI